MIYRCSKHSKFWEFGKSKKLKYNFKQCEDEKEDIIIGESTIGITDPGKEVVTDIIGGTAIHPAQRITTANFHLVKAISSTSDRKDANSFRVRKSHKIKIRDLGREAGRNGEHKENWQNLGLERKHLPR